MFGRSAIIFLKLIDLVFQEKRMVEEQLVKQEQSRRTALFGASKEQKAEAAGKKRSKLKKNEFHEEAFEEMTDTATIFSLRDYLGRPIHIP